MAHEENQGKKTYTCPMHPEVQSDNPGTCPKCGMQLIEKKNTEEKFKSYKKDNLFL
jgi:transcription initiation factor IIE alpha subunit